MKTLKLIALVLSSALILNSCSKDPSNPAPQPAPALTGGYNPLDELVGEIDLPEEADAYFFLLSTRRDVPADPWSKESFVWLGEKNQDTAFFDGIPMVRMGSAGQPANQWRYFNDIHEVINACTWSVKGSGPFDELNEQAGWTINSPTIVDRPETLKKGSDFKIDLHNNYDTTWGESIKTHIFLKDDFGRIRKIVEPGTNSLTFTAAEIEEMAQRSDSVTIGVMNVRHILFPHNSLNYYTVKIGLSSHQLTTEN